MPGNKNNETKPASPEQQASNEQPKSIFGTLLDALKKSMDTDTKFELQDELAHKSSDQGGGFEKAKNANEFNKGTLVKFMIFAAIMLLNKDNNDGDTKSLGDPVAEEAARKKSQEPMSLEQARKMLSGAEVTDFGKRIVENVRKVTSGVVERFIPKDCGKWAGQIYKMSGLKPKRVWPSADQLKVVNGQTQQVRDLKNGNLPEGENEALELVSPGDWVFYYNKNGYGKNTNWEGQHSSIFLRWIDKSKRIARMASGSGGVPGREQTINLLKTPITRIHKPQAA